MKLQNYFERGDEVISRDEQKDSRLILEVQNGLCLYTTKTTSRNKAYYKWCSQSTMLKFAGYDPYNPPDKSSVDNIIHVTRGESGLSEKDMKRLMKRKNRVIITFLRTLKRIKLIFKHMPEKNKLAFFIAVIRYWKKHV